MNIESITITPAEITTVLSFPNIPVSQIVKVVPAIPVFPPKTVIITAIAITRLRYCNSLMVIVLLSCSQAKFTAAAKIAIGIRYSIHPIAYSNCGITFCPIVPGFP